MNSDLITTLPKLIETQAAKYPNKVLFIDENKQVTYKEFQQNSLKVARGLGEIGIGPGDRVATYLPNSIDMIEALYGIATSGAVNVFLNPMYMPREVDIILRDSAAQVLITDGDSYRKTVELYAKLPSLQKVIIVGDVSVEDAAKTDLQVLNFEDLKQHGLFKKIIPMTTTDAVWIQYTSGTTGVPKGAELTHQGIIWVALAVAEVLKFNENDKYIACLPLFHSYASCICVVQPIALGASVVIQRAFSPAKTPDVIEEHKVTMFPAVPTMLNYLLNADTPVDKLQSIKLFLSAGAILTTQLRKQFEGKYNIPVYDGFGTTECHSFVTLNSPDKPRPYGSCGFALPGSQAKIVDKSFNEVKRGELGELVAKGPNVMRGYINRPEATAEAIKDGWYRTGDVSYQDEDGYFFIQGRYKEVIISGAYNIYPKEVEDVIYAMEGILEVAVVGMPDEAKGQIPRAVIVMKDGFEYSEGQVIDYCRQNLARYKLPQTVRFVESLPKTQSGKIKKFELVKQTNFQ